MGGGDTSDRARAETQAMLDSTTALIWAVDRDYLLVSDNAAFRAAQQESTGTHIAIGAPALPGEDPDELTAMWRHYYERALAGERHAVRRNHQFSDDSTYEYRFSPITDAAGEVVGVTVEGLNVTTEIEAERALLASEARFRSIFERTGDVAFLTDSEFTVTFVTDSLREVFGHAPSDAVGQSMWYVFDVNATEPTADVIAARLRERGSRVVATAQLTDARGVRRTIETIIVNLLDDPAVRGYAGSVRDTTDEGEAADLLEYRGSLLRLAGRLAKVGGWAVDATTRLVTLSDELYPLLDAYPHVIDEGLTLDESMRICVRPSRDRLGMAFEQCFADGTPFDIEVEAQTRLGRHLWLQVIGEPQRDTNGRIIAIQGAIADVSERHLHEATLRQQAALLDKANDAIIERLMDGTVVYWNGAAERLYGWSRQEAIGALLPDLVSGGDFQSFDEMNALLQREGEWFGRRMQWRRDGRPFLIENHINVVRDERGEPVGAFSIGSDVTERIELEERLALGQRLESVGQLTGGIAHDFNNLLTVIIGGAELLAKRLADDETLGPTAAMVQSAAESGSQLTSRLLSFARRQSLQPTVVDPCSIVEGMLDLLRRSLSEAVDVSVSHDPDVWTVSVDQGLLEAAIINISVNAGHAMPQGGTLTIQLSNETIGMDRLAAEPDASPGEYVRIRLVDDGEGMEPDVLARAFDPFFTTKDVGKGSGLGLSMVYGFIKQSGGIVEIDSHPGRGTTIDMYLPRADVHGVPDRQPETSATSGGTETVLVVEDNDLVRTHVCQLLRDLGYQVIEAADGPAALVFLASDVPIDLLFTDVVMPNGMSGIELAARAATRQPSLPVLYTSGYTEHSTVVAGTIGDGAHLLTKPYRRDDLARMVRIALDREPR